MDGMSSSCRWCAVVESSIEEAGVMLGGGDTQVFQNLCDQVVPVPGRSQQAIQCFIDQPEVSGTGVGITEG